MAVSLLACAGGRSVRPTPAGGTLVVKQKPSASDTVGTPGPLFVKHVAADGRWVFFCQARRDTNGDGHISVFPRMHHGGFLGDAVEPYFVLGTGEGERLDEFVGADKADRFVVVVRNGHLVVFDTEQRTETDLTKVARASTRTVKRVASLDAAGRLLTYWRDAVSPTTPPALIVRELQTGHEISMQIGDGVPWDAVLAPDGEAVRVSMLRTDTNGDGAITAPTFWTDRTQGSCAGPPIAYTVGRTGGDQPDTFFLSARTGEPDADASMAAPPVSIGSPPPDNVFSNRIAAKTCSVRGATGETLFFGQCVAAHGNRVLMIRDEDNRFLLYDASSNQSLEFPAVSPKWHERAGVQAGSLTALGGFVFDLGAAKFVGALNGDAVAITSDGRVLTRPKLPPLPPPPSDGPPPTTIRLAAIGPLTWERPLVVPADAAPGHWAPATPGEPPPAQPMTTTPPSSFSPSPRYSRSPPPDSDSPSSSPPMQWGTDPLLDELGALPAHPKSASEAERSGPANIDVFIAQSDLVVEVTLRRSDLKAGQGKDVVLGVSEVWRGGHPEPTITIPYQSLVGDGIGISVSGNWLLFLRQRVDGKFTAAHPGSSYFRITSCGGTRPFKSATPNDANTCLRDASTILLTDEQRARRPAMAPLASDDPSIILTQPLHEYVRNKRPW